MKRIPHIVAGMFSVLILLSSFATSVSAEPMITISLGSPPNTLAIPVTDLDVMELCAGDCSQIILVNLTGFDITDFHLTVTPEQPMQITGKGGTVFEDELGTNTSIDFVVGAHSSGIPRGEFFTIFTTGFRSDTVFSGNATASIPEPTSMLLLSTGLAGIAVAIRRRAKQKNYHGSAKDSHNSA